MPQSLKLHRNETSSKLETFYLHAYNSHYRYYHGHIMLMHIYHQRHHIISFENCHFYSQKIRNYCIHVGVFRYLISDHCPLTSYTSMIFYFFCCISFEILILFMNVILSTVLLENLFLSLVNSRPAAEKMCSGGTDFAGTARMGMAMIGILEYLISFFFPPL